MDLQRLYSYTRRAVADYNMIQDQDMIGIACSGGKDSIALALALKGLERFYPHPFKIKAYTVIIGFPDMDFSKLADFFKEKNIPYQVIDTQIKEIVFDVKKESNPCALCATLRKGALYKAMKEDGCNKAALGHHREDVVDTFLLSLLYEGRLHTFQPITDLSDIGLTVIRPLIYCPEKEIIDFKNRYQIPILHNTCPEDGYTKRQEMDDLLRSLNKKDHLTTTRILTAIQESGIDGWHPGVNYRTQKREK